MAFKLPDTAVASLLLVLATLPAARPVAAAGTAAKPACPRIEYKWDNIDGNLRGGQQHITGLEFWSCDARGVETIRVRADDATGPDTDFASGEWRLRRNVVVTIPDGELKGDNAVVVLKNRTIASAAVSGTPASFAQHAASAATGIGNARGEATDFRYDVASGDVSMSGGAFIAYQDTEFRCSLIVYNIGTQKYRGLAARDKGEVCRGQTRTSGAAGASGAEARPPAPGNGTAPGDGTP
jgi:lipopolysaccharide transport protein LptA